MGKKKIKPIGRSFHCCGANLNNLKVSDCDPEPIARSMRDLIDSVKRNKYSPPLDTIEVYIPEFGRKFTMAELDKMLNN